MKFTSSDGREFEEVDVIKFSDAQPQDIVIRPVKDKIDIDLVDKFTDEKGAEFEAEYMHSIAHEDNLDYAKVYKLKPVKQEPKYTVSLEEYTDLNTGGIWIDLNRIETPKAQLIKQKITNLMEEMEENGLL